MPEINLEEFEKDMKEMETRLKVLRAEYNQFLNGTLPCMPNFTVAQIRKIIKKYAILKGLKGIHRFQYFNLVAKFNTMFEFYNRRARDKQEGKSMSYSLTTSSKIGELRQTFRPILKEAPIDRGHIISDVSRQQTTMKTMFNKWLEFTEFQKGTSPKIEFNKFSQLIQSKTEQLMEKKKGRAVKFQMALKDGKVCIQAKIIE
jgi:hypothetical protein